MSEYPTSYFSTRDEDGVYFYVHCPECDCISRVLELGSRSYICERQGCELHWTASYYTFKDN